MEKAKFGVLAAATILVGASGTAQASVTLYNAQGASAPCIGIGPIGGPAAEHCAKMFEQQGFVRASDLGVSGLTVDTSGTTDGLVSSVAPGSAAARAGLAPGDRILDVDGRDVRATPGTVAAERLFGRRGNRVEVSLRGRGGERTVSLELVAQAAPTGPRWDNMLVANRLLVNWRGDFIPCVGAGPLAFGALAYCTSHFKPYGFIDADALGGAGVTLDLDRRDAAVVAAVADGSPAAQAGIAPGETITAIDGRPLAASLGGGATERLFGKPGEVRRLTVDRGGSRTSFSLVLDPAHE